ncbi:MAG: DUF58 domain-containing protein [DPANN group archaeon]|nr:DUF58 domain-containing protein [DPANN group archaeon]
MHKLKLDFKPKLTDLIITSASISGSGPGQGAITRTAGERKSLLYRGKGLEFDRFRVFTPDDDARMIDWKASLRANKILVKVYSEEQNKDIIIFFDVSSTMTYASHKKLKAEYAAELIADLTYNIAQSGDNAGLVMFTDRVVGVIPPQSGMTQYNKILRMLETAKLYDGRFDLNKALGFLNSIVRRQAIVILVSDFIGLKGSWKQAISALSSRMALIGIMIRDPLDDRLPDQQGQLVISDPFTEEEQLVEPRRIAEEYARINRQHINEIKTVFRKKRSDLLILHTDQDYRKPVRNFFMS